MKPMQTESVAVPKRSMAVAGRVLALCAGLLAAGAGIGQPLPQTAAGKVQRLANVPSKFVAPRHVDVWLPPGYGTTGDRYDVLYLQDGQAAFDGAAALNGQGLRVDAVMTRLMREARIRPTLVVAVWNDGARRSSEYYPSKFLSYLPEPVRSDFVARELEGLPRADAYLRFLVAELKPLIDSRFHTAPGRTHTFIAGGGLAGLLSIYALCEYPTVFAGAAALSPLWTGIDEPNAMLPLAAFNYLQARLAEPADHRLYLDRGTAGTDALQGDAQRFVERLAKDAGYGRDRLLSLAFDGTVGEERAWAARLDLPLLFLMGIESTSGTGPPTTAPR